MTCECSVRDIKPDEKKIFVGGLHENISSTMLAEYFEKYGPVLSAKVVRGDFKGEVKSRGFGFVVFVNKYTADKVFVKEHWLKGKKLEIRKSELKKPDSRVYVQNIHQHLSIQQLRTHFSDNFGKVKTIFRPFNTTKNEYRLHCHVYFEESEAAIKCLAQPDQYIGNFKVTVSAPKPQYFSEKLNNSHHPVMQTTPPQFMQNPPCYSNSQNHTNPTCNNNPQPQCMQYPHCNSNLQNHINPTCNYNSQPQFMQYPNCNMQNLPCNCNHSTVVCPSVSVLGCGCVVRFFTTAEFVPVSDHDIHYHQDSRISEDTYCLNDDEKSESASTTTPVAYSRACSDKPPFMPNAPPFTPDFNNNRSYPSYSQQSTNNWSMYTTDNQS